MCWTMILLKNALDNDFIKKMRWTMILSKNAMNNNFIIKMLRKYFDKNFILYITGNDFTIKKSLQ